MSASKKREQDYEQHVVNEEKERTSALKDEVYSKADLEVAIIYPITPSIRISIAFRN